MGLYLEDFEINSPRLTRGRTIGEGDVSLFAGLVGDHNPLWFDPDYARKHGYRDIVCPPLYLQYAILGVAALGDLRPDGSSGAATGSMAFPRAPRRMAGGESTTAVSICPRQQQQRRRAGCWNGTNQFAEVPASLA